MLTIGLIGGIASGKSEVARLLREHGAVVIDADRVAHEAYAPGTEGHAAIVRTFGGGLIAEDGSIDRRKLGALVFENPERMRQLTDIVWPLARRLLELRLREQEEAGTRIVVIEAAIMVEAGWDDLVDEVWMVRTSVDTARTRLMERRGLSREDADSRIAARNLGPLVEAADLVIDNDAGLEELAQRVDEAWRRAVAPDSGQ